MPGAESGTSRPVGGDGRPYITLAQLAKREEWADSGGQAKHLVRAGGCTVNGEAELRPGRKLHQGDIVVRGAITVVVDLGPPTP
jgi:ribosome-associated protein